MPNRTALITFEAVSWSGWSRDHKPATRRVQVRVRPGEALNPVTLGDDRSDYKGVESLFFDVWPETIFGHKVIFCYRRLVIANPSGTVNLTAPNAGRFVLMPGQSMKLATPTMDAGVSVTVTLDQID